MTVHVEIATNDTHFHVILFFTDLITEGVTIEEFVTAETAGIWL
jgi:hypothetical protein